MMQVARKEVHRMDVEIRSSRSQQQDKSATDVSDQATSALAGKLHMLETEKKSLMQTLRKMLDRNSTRIFQKEAQNAERAEKDLSAKFDKERSDLQAHIKEANDKAEEAQDLAQTLQQQNLDLKKSQLDLQAKLKVAEENDKGLATDKANLMETLHGFMRENMRIKKALAASDEKQSRIAKQLAVDEAKITNLTKNAQRPAAAKPARKPVSKNAPLHLKHEDSTALRMSKMNHINDYIDRSYSGDDSSDSSETISENILEKVDATTAKPRKESYWSGVAKQEGALEKNLRVPAGDLKHVSAKSDQDHQDQDLGKWLGLKSAAAAKGAIPLDADGMSPIDALDPEAVKQEKTKQKAAEVTKAKDDEDDGGDGIDKLLSQAKEQLDAMDRAEARN